MGKGLGLVVCIDVVGVFFGLGRPVYRIHRILM